jgi:hypothetical protein
VGILRHGGPLLSSGLAVARHLPHTAGIRRGPPPQLLREPGQPPGRARETAGVRTIIENLIWRVLFTVAIAAALLAKLPAVLGWLLPGHSAPPKEALQAAAGLVTVTVGATTAVLLRLTYRKLGRQEPPYLELLTGAVAAVGTLLAVVLYK